MVMPLSLRELLLVQVRDRVAVDEREVASIAAFLTEFETLRSPFDEHADPVHVTASAIVVGDRGVVLHLHKRLGIWLQPGGHIDPGETPWNAALREASEETGLPVSWPGAPGVQPLAHVDVHPGPRGHRHLDLRYLVHADDVDPKPGPQESQDVRWFSWAEALEVADAGVSGLLRELDPRAIT
jgi:8-oxo-dGTP pyrophosphatase MutT (NUDIX family)